MEACASEYAFDPIWIALFVVPPLDYFLGKSKKTQSNSIVELLLKLFLRRKP